MDFKINRIKHKRPICEQCLPLEKCGVGEAFQRNRDLSPDGGIADLHRTGCFFILFLERERVAALECLFCLCEPGVSTKLHCASDEATYCVQLSMRYGVQKYLKCTTWHEVTGIICTRELVSHVQSLSSLSLVSTYPKAPLTLKVCLHSHMLLEFQEACVLLPMHTLS